MRVWEFEDNKAISSNLVREQDFIMRIRRLHRMGEADFIVNIVFSAFESPVESRGPLEEAHHRLQEFATAKNATFCEMSNGDVFLVFAQTVQVQTITDQIMLTAFQQNLGGNDKEKGLKFYQLPQDYNLLRERANQYVEMVHLAAERQDGSTPAQLLQSDAARGPLSAWSVNQIELLLNDINLRRYVRTQTVYKRNPDGRFVPVFDEFFIAFEALRNAHFPHLELHSPEHLFLELCQAMDRRLLFELSEHFDTLQGRNISLNLAVASVTGSVFAQFVRKIPRSERGRIIFELHRGDLLQDFSATLNAMLTLHQEGFLVAIDSVTPDLLGYLNLALFETDFIKLNVAKDRAALLDDPKNRAALQQLRKEKIIFYRCDSDRALKQGLELGVNLFQGWLMDERAKE